jgi:hypothetical protein
VPLPARSVEALAYLYPNSVKNSFSLCTCINFTDYSFNLPNYQKYTVEILGATLLVKLSSLIKTPPPLLPLVDCMQSVFLLVTLDLGYDPNRNNVTGLACEFATCRLAIATTT